MMDEGEAVPMESTGKHPTVQPGEADVVPFRPAEQRAGGPGDPAGVESRASATASGERPTVGDQPAAAAPRPPVLASDSLREDMEPTEPWLRTLRYGGTGMALLGALLSLALGGLHWAALVLALLLLAAGGLCASPVRYAQRALGVLSLAGMGLAIATTARLFEGAPVEAPVLALGTVVLAGGLLFRSAYRASQLARTVVAGGMLTIAVGLVLADAVGEFSGVGVGWQSWLHVVTATGFGILLLLSLLAFMAPSTTGGAQVWAATLLVWYALHVALTLVTRFFPPPAGGPAASLPDGPTGVAVAAAALAGLAAVALAQTLVVSAGGTIEHRSRPSGPAPAQGE